MAEVLVFWDERYGPAQVWTLPASPIAQPRTAYVPGGPFGVAQAHVSSKGDEASWQEWAERLTRQVPYTVTFHTETVPDGMTPHQALDLVRQRNQDEEQT